MTSCSASKARTMRSMFLETGSPGARRLVLLPGNGISQRRRPEVPAIRASIHSSDVESHEPEITIVNSFVRDAKERIHIGNGTGYARVAVGAQPRARVGLCPGP